MPRKREKRRPKRNSTKAALAYYRKTGRLRFRDFEEVLPALKADIRRSERLTAADYAVTINATTEDMVPPRTHNPKLARLIEANRRARKIAASDRAIRINARPYDRPPSSERKRR